MYIINKIDSIIFKNCFDIDNLNKYKTKKEKIKNKYSTYTAMADKDEIKIEKERVKFEINNLDSTRATTIYSIFSIIFPLVVTIFYDTFKNEVLFLSIYLMIAYIILCLTNAYQNKKLQYYYIAKDVLEELEKELS